MGARCVQKGILFFELGRTERGRFHISSEPHQGPFGSHLSGWVSDRCGYRMTRLPDRLGVLRFQMTYLHKPTDKTRKGCL